MITVKELGKRRGSTLVLDDITLEVGRGETLAIIGPSGGGKSTFLRCVNGLEPFHTGEVRVSDDVLLPSTHAGRDPVLLQRVRQRVGMVFQQFNLFPHMTTLQNLIEAPLQVLREPRDRATERARKLLERMGLSTKLDAYPRNLSGGQQQRVAIARALMMKPEAILFDEPTSALDPVMAGEVLAVMADLAKDGQTMVVVTHSMSFARNAASRIHVFADGRDVERGPPDQIFGAPEHATTRAFLAEALR
jgi:polar amino acid transport system ATP-binding protein